MTDLQGVLYDDILEVAEDSAKLAMAQVGLGTADQVLIDDVYADVEKFAADRSAELLSEPEDSEEPEASTPAEASTDQADAVTEAATSGDQSIVTSTKAMVLATIVAGITAGSDAATVAQAVQDSYAFSAKRAAIIAATEIAKANGQGKLLGYLRAQAEGVEVLKVWNIVPDGHAEMTCIANALQGPIPLGQPFLSGDLTEPAHPNCRCETTVYEPDPA